MSDEYYSGGYGSSPLKGARTPTGYVKVDKNGNEIGGSLNVVNSDANVTGVKKDFDILDMPEFKEAFGADVANLFAPTSDRVDNTLVTIKRGTAAPIKQPSDNKEGGSGESDPYTENKS